MSGKHFTIIVSSWKQNQLVAKYRYILNVNDHPGGALQSTFHTEVQQQLKTQNRTYL